MDSPRVSVKGVVPQLEARPRGVQVSFANDASLRRTGVAHTVQEFVHGRQKRRAAERDVVSLDHAQAFVTMMRSIEICLRLNRKRL